MTPEEFWDAVSSNPAIEKIATDCVNDFIRNKLGEQGMLRSILQPDRTGMWIGKEGAYVQLYRDGRWINGTVVERAAFRLTIVTDDGVTLNDVDINEEELGTIRLHKPSQVLYDRYRSDDAELQEPNQEN